MTFGFFMVLVFVSVHLLFVEEPLVFVGIWFYDQDDFYVPMLNLN